MPRIRPARNSAIRDPDLRLTSATCLANAAPSPATQKQPVDVAVTVPGRPARLTSLLPGDGGRRECGRRPVSSVLDFETPSRAPGEPCRAVPFRAGATVRSPGPSCRSHNRWRRPVGKSRCLAETRAWKPTVAGTWWDVGRSDPVRRPGRKSDAIRPASNHFRMKEINLVKDWKKRRIVRKARRSPQTSEGRCGELQIWVWLGRCDLQPCCLPRPSRETRNAEVRLRTSGYYQASPPANGHFFFFRTQVYHVIRHGHAARDMGALYPQLVIFPLSFSSSSSSSSSYLALFSRHAFPCTGQSLEQLDASRGRTEVPARWQPAAWARVRYLPSTILLGAGAIGSLNFVPSHPSPRPRRVGRVQAPRERWGHAPVWLNNG